MTAPGTAGDQPLDFTAPAVDKPSNPQCASCKAEIIDQYWSAGPAVLCGNCRDAVELGQTAPAAISARTGRFARALLFGLGGMLAGATVWYLIAKLANLQIGLIAILLGYLVGKGVFEGSGKRGGQRYQILAVILTYLGIGLAYLPFVLEGMQGESTAVAVIGSIYAVFTLPVLSTIGDLPGGLISLLIYAFAIMEAWKLTRAARLELTGPFKVGGAAKA